LQNEIAERSRVGEALQTSETFLHSLLENLPIKVYRKDLAGRYIFANRHVYEWIGCEPHELLGKTDFDFASRERAEKNTEEDATVMATRRPLDIVKENFMPNGEQRWTNIVKVAVINQDGQVAGAHAVDGPPQPRARGGRPAGPLLGRHGKQTLGTGVKTGEGGGGGRDAGEKRISRQHES